MRQIRVAAGVLRDDEGRILLSRRPEGKHLAGYWEFPGGKASEGETITDALSRELEEELGVEVQSCEKICSALHRDEQLTVDIAFFEVRYRGEPSDCEGQEMRWVAPRELRSYALPPADAELVALLSE